jgi:hypothetical protein
LATRAAAVAQTEKIPPFLASIQCTNGNHLVNETWPPDAAIGENRAKFAAEFAD